MPILVEWTLLFILVIYDLDYQNTFKLGIRRISLMNSNKRLIGGLFLVLAILSVASAAYDDYDIDVQILPGTIYENNKVLIAGYITIEDWGDIISVDSFEMKVIEGSTLKKLLTLSDTAMTYVNDANDTTLLVDGFFYTEISGLDAGSYVVKILLNGNEVKIKRFTVLDGETNLTLNFDGFTLTDGPYYSLEYDNAGIVTGDVYFYGRNNFDSPATIRHTGIAGNSSPFEAPEMTGFSLDTYADEDEVFGFIIVANVTDGALENSFSDAKVVVNNRGFKDSTYSAYLSVNSKDLKKGTNDTLSMILTNNGSLLSNYVVELSGSLSSYASITSPIELQPEASKSDSISINLPRNHVSTTGDLTVTVKVNGQVIAEQVLNINLLAADPVHSISADSIQFSKSSYFKGENVIGTITLVNDGDYTETVLVEYYFQNEDHTKEYVELSPGTSQNFTIIAPAADVSTLVVSVTNDYITYTTSSNANIVTKNYDFNFYLDDADVISQDASTETVGLVIENKGNVEDLFVILSDYANHELSDNGVEIDSSDSTTVTATVNIPVNEDSLNVTFTVCSRIGNKCINDSLLITIFKTEGGLTESDSVVNITEPSLSGAVSEGLIYTFDVTNNKLVSKNYQLEYEANSTIDFSVYPGVNFTVQPGETMKVFMHATPAVGGDYEINYTVTESGAVFANGTLSLAAGTSLDNLTGLAVAAGSALGVVGLIVLVLFIYFYFIRRPPEGEDEFRPVEVKKADLTKPNVKNEKQYW